MPLKLGVLVPSSNTALEPLTTSILAALAPDVTVHFSRFRVTSISLDPSALAQFDLDRNDSPILEAASLLADAGVDVIGWSGTSAGWLGFDSDVKLCAAITQKLGIPATTSVLALNKALALTGAKSLGLVTPFSKDVQEQIIKTYNNAGYNIVSESHLGIQDNRLIATVSPDALDQQVRDVLEKPKAEVQAITTFCTNLAAAQLVANWESKHNIPVFDTVTTVVWDMLSIVGYDKMAIVGWGRIFQMQ